MIDPKFVTQPQAIKTSFVEMMKGVCTSIPAHIVTFNPALQRAQVQIGIQTVLIDGTTEAPRVIEDVPVVFPGSDYTLEFQVGNGTEGCLIFSQRCIDGWKNSGGIAANPLARFFDRQDCYFIPGMRSQPGAITGFQNNGIRLRNKAGNQFAWLKGDGSVELANGAGFVRLMANGTVNINGVTIDAAGNINAPQNVAVGGTLRNGGVNVGKDHKHSGVQTGSGTTGNPI